MPQQYDWLSSNSSFPGRYDSLLLLDSRSQCLWGPTKCCKDHNHATAGGVLQASADVLAMAALEVDLSTIKEGNCVTVKW